MLTDIFKKTYDIYEMMSREVWLNTEREPNDWRD